MIDKFKTILMFILTAIATLFGGYALIQKKRADKKEQESDELEKQLEVEGYNYEVKNFEAINKERKDVADDKLDKEFDNLDHKLNGNTTYRL